MAAAYELHKRETAALNGSSASRSMAGAGRWAWARRMMYPLKEARAAAERWRAMVRANLDPIKERERQRREAGRSLLTLREIAADAFREPQGRAEGRRRRRPRVLAARRSTSCRSLAACLWATSSQTDIRDTLAPIWHAKADTARKAMNRLSICLRHAGLGLEVDLQAPEKAKALLGRQRHKATNIPALPWAVVRPSMPRSAMARSRICSS